MDNKPPEQSNFMDSKQVCAYLNISPATLHRLIKNRDVSKIPAYRIGKVYRFKKDLLDKWCEEKLL